GGGSCPHHAEERDAQGGRNAAGLDRSTVEPGGPERVACGVKRSTGLVSKVRLSPAFTDVKQGPARGLCFWPYGASSGSSPEPSPRLESHPPTPPPPPPPTPPPPPP